MNTLTVTATCKKNPLAGVGKIKGTMWFSQAANEKGIIKHTIDGSRITVTLNATQAETVTNARAALTSRFGDLIKFTA